MTCWRHRTVALGLAVGFAGLALAPAVQAAEPLPEDPTEELSRLRSADAELEDRLATIEQWLAEGQERLGTLDEEVRQAEAAIEEAAAKVARAQREAERQEARVRDRAVAAYVHPARVETLPASDDVNEAAERSVFVQQVAAYDREVLGTKVEAEERLEAAEAEAQSARDDLAATADEVTALLDGLFAQQDEAEAAEAELAERIKEVQDEVDAMAEASGGLTGLINDLSGADGAEVGSMLIPVDGTLTSRFGQRWGRLHAGIDIAAPTGRPISAAAAGRTIYASWMSGYGNVVIVDHGGGLSTLYGHQSRILTDVGDTLDRGEVLGEIGSTGNSTGPHLHFEVRERGVPTDPIPYLSS